MRIFRDRRESPGRLLQPLRPRLSARGGRGRRGEGGRRGGGAAAPGGRDAAAGRAREDGRDRGQEGVRPRAGGGPQALAEADAIILGTPTRYGAATAQMQAFLDATGGLWVRGP